MVGRWLNSRWLVIARWIRGEEGEERLCTELLPASWLLQVVAGRALGDGDRAKGGLATRANQVLGVWAAGGKHN